jgi:hypothetical protein
MITELTDPAWFMFGAGFVICVVLTIALNLWDRYDRR